VFVGYNKSQIKGTEEQPIQTYTSSYRDY